MYIFSMGFTRYQCKFI